MNTITMNQDQMIEVEGCGMTHGMRIIGCGGGAHNMIRYCANMEVDAGFGIVDNWEGDRPECAACSIRYPQKAKASEVIESISTHWDETLVPMIEGAEKVVLVACLASSGGEIMSGLVERIKMECAAKVNVFVTMPFAFEGRSRKKCAEECLKMIQDAGVSVMAVKNDEMTKNGPMGLSEAFAKVNDKLREYVMTI